MGISDEEQGLGKGRKEVGKRRCLESSHSPVQVRSGREGEPGKEGTSGRPWWVLNTD